MRVWRQMAPLLRKEFLEAWRDRRALWMAVIFALLFPVLLAGGMIFMVKQQAESSSRLALVGASDVPLLERSLRGPGIQLEALEAGDPSQLLAESYDLVLQVAPDFQREYRDLRAPKLYLYLNSSRPGSARAERQLQERLAGLQQLVAGQRLVARGVAPQLLAPWQLQVRDVSTPSSRGALILAAVPGLLIFTLFVASLASSVDTSAGERERLSLEALLLTPLPRWQIVAAKTLAVASLGWLGSLLSIGALVALMPAMPLAQLGIQQATTAGGVLTMGLLLLPLALLVAVVQILLALRSQSFKDAQTQLSILQMAPVTLLVVLDAASVELARGWQLLPLVGQQQWLKALLVGDWVSPLWMLAGSALCLLLVAAAIAFGARALNRESLLGAV